ncbi:hypothetical protein ABFX02_06G110000 [Erythranthe guttata]
MAPADPPPLPTPSPFRPPAVPLPYYSSKTRIPNTPSSIFHIFSPVMAQKVVMKVLTMTDEKTRQKAIEAAADVLGVDSIAADMKEQKVTVVGEMDAVAVVKKLKKVGKVDILSIGPAKEDKKPDQKPAQDKK